MAKVTQYSRISHHTLAGSTSATFSIPPSEDFTDGSWSIYDLSLSEIGVNEDSKKAYIRINDEVKEFEFVGGTAGSEDLQSTLSIGNTTGANDIIVDLDRQIKTTDTGYIQFGDTGADLNSITITNGGDGITTPANGFGFSGIDPYWTAQTVDIGGVTDTLYLDPTGIGTLGSSGILSDDGTNNAVLSMMPTGIQLNNTGTNNIGNISISSAVQLSSSNSVTSDNSQIDIYDNNINIFSNDASGLKLDSLSVDPQNLGNGTGVFSTDVITGDSSGIYFNPLLSGYSVNNNGNGNLSSIQLDDNTIEIKNSDTASSITDTLRIDPQSLVAKTSIKSENSSTLENSFIDFSPAQMNIKSQNSSPTTTDIFIQPTQFQSNVYDSSSSTQLQQNSTSIQLVADDTTSSYLQLNKRIIYSYDIQTTNNTTTTMFNIPITNNTAKSVKASIIALKDDYTKAYGSEMYAVFRNNGGTVAQVSTTDVTSKTDFSTATSTIDFSGTNIRIRVTGETATNINWSLQVECINSL